MNSRKTMSWKVLGPIAACAALSLSALGCHTEVVVRQPPPPERVETVAAAPSAEHFWVRGHWEWNGAEWVWRPGHWETRRHHMVWKPGYWRDTGRGWVWVEGRWVER
jgi:hypothetical protein